MDIIGASTHAPGDVTGLVLRLDDLGDNSEPIEARFSKNRARIIHIGRKSAQNPGEYVVTDDRALFRCAVVSRQHAKLTFTDHGNVFITDLGSHHGTHILRAGDTTAKTLPAQVAHVLSEGDTITFGKTVMRDESQVRPIVAHISLVHASSLSLSSPVPHAQELPNSDRQLSKSHSGRYGVYVSSSSEDEDESDDDSVVFLHSSPPRGAGLSNHLPSFQSLRSANFSLNSARSINDNLLLPPIHTLFSASVSRSSSVMEISPIEDSPSRGGVVGSGLLENAAFQIDPEFTGAWPKTPILRSRSGSPFPRESKDDLPTSSGDGADAHASSGEAQIEVNVAVDAPEDTSDEQHIKSSTSFEDSTSEQPSPSGVNVEAVSRVSEVDGGASAEPGNESENISGNSKNSEHVAVDSHIITQDVAVEAQADMTSMNVEVQAVAINGASSEDTSSDAMGAVKESVAAIEKLRRKAEEDLAAIKAAHAETELALAKMKASATATTSLKRKRAIEDEDVAYAFAAAPLAPLPFAPASPPAKRRRVLRLISKVAQTTAIASVGAIAAWSALAFS